VIVGWQKRLTVPVTFAALTAVQFFHSIEELATGLYTWFPRVTGAMREKVDFIPQLSISRTNFAIANAVIVVFMLGISVLLFRRVPWAVRVARAVAFVEILNGIGHLMAAIIKREYFPGAVSAVGLVILGVLFLRADFIERAVSKMDKS
jgi:hypothetical protein